MEKLLGEEIRYAAGSVIMAEGNPVERIVEIVEGEVLLTARDLFDPTASPIIYATLGASDIAGEILLCPWTAAVSPYTAVVSSSHPQALVRAFTLQEFEAYLGDGVAVVTRILGRMADNRIRQCRRFRKSVSEARMHRRYRMHLSIDPEMGPLLETIANLDERIREPSRSTQGPPAPHPSTDTLQSGIAPVGSIDPLQANTIPDPKEPGGSDRS